MKSALMSEKIGYFPFDRNNRQSEYIFSNKYLIFKYFSYNYWRYYRYIIATIKRDFRKGKAK